MTTGNSLSTKTKQKRAIAALLTARDMQAAAEQAGISESTLHRWMREDKEFRAELQAVEAEAIDNAVRRLTGAANSALNVVMLIMLDGNTPASTRLRAAISVLEQLIKLRELNNLEQRIADLEAKVEASEGRTR